MNLAPEILEQQLIASYQRQANEYERALRILEANSGSSGKVAGGETKWAQDLHDVLVGIASLDAGLAEVKSAWQQSGHKPEGELRSLLDHLAARIRVLGEHIDGQVAELVARKQRLQPEIDAFIRQRWMLDAYCQSALAAKK